MNEQAKNFQEILELLEAGESLETVQKILPEEDHDSLLLVSRLRAADWPQRDPQVASSQKKQVLAMYSQEAEDESRSRPRFNLFKDWRLPAALLSAAAIFLICGLATVLGLGALWFSNQRVVSSPTIVGETSEAAETVESSAAAGGPLDELASDEVLLSGVRGLVEIQVGETWQIVSEQTVLTREAHLRTGNFSTASLSFKDGSLAQVGPNSEISIEKLAADPASKIREIVLMQWRGESKHNVAPFESAEAAYQVNTPSSQGTVQGTQFHLRILPEGTNWYVDSGKLDVRVGEATVNVEAGEMTEVSTDQEPTDPVYFITGQGEVTSIGDQWVIGDQTYQTHPHTIIIGNPLVGDLVFFEGHLLEDGTRVVDLIVLIRRNPANTFTLTGEVQSISEDETLWEVNGLDIVVPEDADVEEGITSGDLVRVKGIILAGGTLQAEEIRLISIDDGTPFEFIGVVQEMGAESWLISDITVTVDINTEIDEGLAVGDSVQVRGTILDDELWLASSITYYIDQKRSFEFVGYLESMGAEWAVSGISFEVREWTIIDEGLNIGDLVRVVGEIQPDGTWLASEVRHYDGDLLTVLIGRVESTDPWVVSGFELAVDGETIIEGEIAVGMLVRVELLLHPDGSHKVIRISPLKGFDWEVGCQYLVVTVIGIDGNKLILDGWPSIELNDDVQIEGEIKPGSILQIMICYDEDMNVSMVYIIVLSGPDDLPPDEGEDDDEDGKEGKKDKVMVCHKPNSKNPHTIVISSSAVPAHLGHGDILGPCP
jgi:hypothetical protein